MRPAAMRARTRIAAGVSGNDSRIIERFVLNASRNLFSGFFSVF
jgi:hypothetical protein